MLIEPRLAAEILSETTDQDFSGAYQAVYQCCRSLFDSGKPVDPVLIHDLLGDSYDKLLLDIMDVTPSAANYQSYLDTLRRKSKIARLKQIAQDIMISDDPEQIAKAISDANNLMVQRTSYRITTMDQAMLSFFDRQDAKKEYLSWPIDGLSDRLYVESGDYLILGGYPSSGKSAYSLQCAWHWATSGKRVGFFSLETSAEKLIDRQVSSVFGIDLAKIKTNSMTSKEMDYVARHSQKMCNAPIEYIQAAGMTVSDIKSVAAMRKYDIIIVDYLQLLRSPKVGNRYEVVTQISIDLHTLAQTTGLIILALAQLSRPEKGSVSTPTMSSIRESGQIEQDADVIMMIYQKPANNDYSTREMSILKNKEGKLGTMTLEFDGAHQTFRRKPKQAPTPDPDGFEKMIEEEERRYQQLYMQN